MTNTMKQSNVEETNAEVDYGAAADMHASDSDDEAEEEVLTESSRKKENQQYEDDDDDDAEEEEERFENVNEDDNNTSSSSVEEYVEEINLEDEEEVHSNPNNHNNTIVVDGGDEPCTFDLRNLLAFNAHPIDTALLYNAAKKPEGERATIPSQVSVDERHLYKKALDGCQQLIAALWQLPTERSDAGPMVRLPANDDSRVPRALVCIVLFLGAKHSSSFSPFHLRQKKQSGSNLLKQRESDRINRNDLEKFGTKLQVNGSIVTDTKRPMPRTARIGRLWKSSLAMIPTQILGKNNAMPRRHAWTRT